MDWSVLQVIHRLGATPQHKLAEHIGRQRSTINGAVRRLAASGWLTRVGQAGSGRGRPAILLAVKRSAGCFAGVDIAADDLHCAVVGADGKLLDHVTSRLGKSRSPQAVGDQIDLNLRGVLSRAGYGVDDLLGLWAGINGAVDERGTVVTCASLGWRNVAFRSTLAERFKCDVLVQGGSAVMHAAAEALMGAGREAESLVYYHAGRGISARFVQKGVPLSGATQRAGELGHVVVAPEGARCACGNRGCLEAVASGPAIAAAIAKLPRRTLPEDLRVALRESDGDSTSATVHAAFKHYGSRSTDKLSALLDQVTRYLAMGAAMAVAAYDPAILVLGGYLFDRNPSVRKGVQRMLRNMVLDWAARDLKVVQGEVLTQDRAVGGAAEVCQRFWANPRGVVATS
jgi:predicted NBD/HSP70 family sugar kinase